MTRFLVAAFFALAVSAGEIAVRAHEIGTSRVDVFFGSDGRYRIEVVTDAAALVEKLESAGGLTPPAAPGELASRLRALDELFRRRVSVAFDGQPVSPAIDYTVEASDDGGAAPRATIVLTGLLPNDARSFAWSYSWTFAPYAFSVGHAATTERVTRWLEGGQESGPIALTAPEAPVGRLRVALLYLSLGFTHIVPKGLDHVLFVLGIFLLNRRLRPVLWQVSAFTAAHSITLALSMVGAIAISPAFVEPMIALSIVYVAVENLFVTELHGRRIALVFAFGLLHGLGFAGVLRDLGLPASELATALLTFNLGVEAGQLAVIGAAFLLIGWRCGPHPWYRRLIVVPASAAIACVAMYWTIVRLPF